MNLVARIAAFLALWPAAGLVQAQDPLPAWNEGLSKRAIVDFVAKVTQAGSPDFVPPAERIAVFDNDGTLWCVDMKLDWKTVFPAP
jgi:hypothetical protein